MGFHRCNRHIEHTSAALEGLLESKIGYQPGDHVLHFIDLQQAGPQPVQRADQAGLLLYLLQHVLRCKNFAQLLIGVATHEAAHDRATAGAGHDIRQQALLPQRFHHAHMEI